MVALNGSPVRGSSVERLVEALCAGVAAAGGRPQHLRCAELNVVACQACGPEPTSEYCVYHDDMDTVFEALHDAHAVIVASPVYFDTVSAQLKRVIDRCNCITPLVRLEGGGYDCVPRWARTRRGIFVATCSSAHRYDLAERSVRGFLKWVGAKWEETLVWQHEDNVVGSVQSDPELLARAAALGRRLVASAPLEA